MLRSRAPVILVFLLNSVHGGVYKRNGDIAYYFSEGEGRDWFQATTFCGSLAGQLPLPTSETQLDYIGTNIDTLYPSTSGRRGFFIDINDAGTENTWKDSAGNTIYVHGGASTGKYSIWITGEPNNSGGVEHYGEAYRYGAGDWQYNDLPGDYAMLAWLVCEINLCSRAGQSGWEAEMSGANGDWVAEGGTVTITCPPGEIATVNNHQQNSQTATTTCSGGAMADILRCLPAACGMPEESAGTNIAGTDPTPHGQDITYTCAADYTMLVDGVTQAPFSYETKTCNNGTFPETPSIECLVSCPTPTATAGVNITGLDPTPHGSDVTFTCTDGLVMTVDAVEATSFTKTCQNGAFGGEVIECKETPTTTTTTTTSNQTNADLPTDENTEEIHIHDNTRRYFGDGDVLPTRTVRSQLDVNGEKIGEAEILDPFWVEWR